MTDIEALRARMREAAEKAKAAGSSWYACADERFVASEAGHIGARTVAEVYDRRDRDFIAAATPDAFLALDAEITRLREDLDRVTRERDEALKGIGPDKVRRDTFDLQNRALNLMERRAESAEAALAKRDEEVAQAVAAERAAWEAELRPLIEAGAFEGVLFTACEQCGALLTDDEVAPIEDGPKGCWRAATGRDKDNCPGEGRKRITATLTKEPTNA